MWKLVAAMRYDMNWCSYSAGGAYTCKTRSDSVVEKYSNPVVDQVFLNGEATPVSATQIYIWDKDKAMGEQCITYVKTTGGVQTSSMYGLIDDALMYIPEVGTIEFGVDRARHTLNTLTLHCKPFIAKFLHLPSTSTVYQYRHYMN